ncbi:hypothetical protein Tco_0807938, partial [Tanacetum coccineum]
SIYFIGGFGTVASVNVKEYEALQPDEIAVNGGNQKCHFVLNYSIDNRYKESLQFQLLEDIARRLEEIKLLNEPKTSRQASVPLPSSKALLFEDIGGDYNIPKALDSNSVREFDDSLTRVS